MIDPASYARYDVVGDAFESVDAAATAAAYRATEPLFEAAYRELGHPEGGFSRVLDKALIPVMDKVKVVANEEFESLFPKFQPSQVTITTMDGKSYTKRVDVPKGDPRDPMTAEEIGVKFTALAKGVIGEAKCKALADLIMRMDTLGSVKELTAATVK